MRSTMMQHWRRVFRARAPSAPFDLPAAGGEDPVRLVQRRLLHPGQGAPRGRGPPHDRHDAGLSEASRRARWDRRGAGGPQGVLGTRGPGRVEAGLGRTRGGRATRGRRDRPVGDGHAHHGGPLALHPPGDGLPRLPRAPDARDAQRPSGGRRRRRQADPVLPRAARPLADPDRRWLGRTRGRRHRRLHRRAGLLVGPSPTASRVR
jgi:hypothetical protein